MGGESEGKQSPSPSCGHIVIRSTGQVREQQLKLFRETGLDRKEEMQQNRGKNGDKAVRQAGSGWGPGFRPGFDISSLIGGRISNCTKPGHLPL